MHADVNTMHSHTAWTSKECPRTLRTHPRRVQARPSHMADSRLSARSLPLYQIVDDVIPQTGL